MVMRITRAVDINIQAVSPLLKIGSINISSFL